MTQKNWIIIVAVLVAVLVSGCQESSTSQKVTGAEMRWQRTINHARLQAARQSLEEGRLMYAQRILEECQREAQPDSRYAERINQMMAQIQTENNRYAKAGETYKNIEEMAY
jgi:predicted Zn-dependent protease